MQNDSTKSNTSSQQGKQTEKTGVPLQPVKITDGIPTSVAANKTEKQSLQPVASEPKSKSEEAVAPNKMEIATKIYMRMQRNKNVTRKEVIEEFVKEAKLSKAGASTYYQLIKAKLGS